MEAANAYRIIKISISKENNSIVSKIEGDKHLQNFPFLKDNLLGNYHYTNGDIESAYKFYKTSFIEAKYCGGPYIREIGYDFLAITARLKKKNEFKNIYRWLEYTDAMHNGFIKQLGIEESFEYFKKFTFVHINSKTVSMEIID
jgi:hypothetical protein